MRQREWAANVSYLSGNEDGEEFYDIAIYDRKLYLCIKSHTSNNTPPPTSISQHEGLWVTAQDWTFVATKLLLAEKITADQIDVDSIFSGTIKANNATIQDFNATNVKITSGTIGGFEIADGRIGVEDITKGIGIIISTNAIGVHLDNRMTGKVIAGLGDFALSSDATRGEALIVKQTIPGGKSHGITRSTALIEVHGGDNPSYKGRRGAGGRQVGLRIITDNGDKDIALDIKGRVRVFDSRNPLADLFGTTTTVTYEGWDTNGKPALCHLNFIDGILTNVSFSPR